jgi:hypothetical protein
MSIPKDRLALVILGVKKTTHTRERSQTKAIKKKSAQENINIIVLVTMTTDMGLDQQYDIVRSRARRCNFVAASRAVITSHQIWSQDSHHLHQVLHRSLVFQPRVLHFFSQKRLKMPCLFNLEIVNFVALSGKSAIM